MKMVSPIFSMIIYSGMHDGSVKMVQTIADTYFCCAEAIDKYQLLWKLNIFLIVWGSLLHFYGIF